MKVLETYSDGTVLIECTLGEIKSLYESRGVPITKEQIFDCALCAVAPPKLPPSKNANNPN